MNERFDELSNRNIKDLEGVITGLLIENEKLREKIFMYENSISSGELHWKIVAEELRSQLSHFSDDAKRFQHIRDNMTSCNSLHMDGTAYFRVRSPKYRTATFAEAIDKEME